MSVFNSLGSNYTSDDVWAGYRPSPNDASDKLRAFLQEHYQAAGVHLTYKGREAITLVLKQLGVPQGSYVAVNGHTCYAVYDAIIAAGSKPYYIDIERDNLNFTPERLTEALKAEPNIKAVMVQDTLGLPADVPAIKKLCDQANIPLIEDLAHAVGLRYADGNEAGTVGQATALSFSQDKMIDGVAGGAAIMRVPPVETVPEETFQKLPWRHNFVDRHYPANTAFIRATLKSGIGKLWLRAVKSFKLIPRPMNGQAATPHRLTNWYSDRAAASFKRLPDLIKHRQRIAAIYHQELPDEIQFPYNEQAVYLRFPLQVDDQVSLIAYLKKFDIHISDTWYDAPIAPKRLFSSTDYKGQCPNSEYVSAHMINLPTHIHVSEKTAKLITIKVNEWLTSP